jgi:diaminopimelate epimerase
VTSGLRFSKAHGLGNDFVLVEASRAPNDVGPWARRLCDRHAGIGADGVLIYRVREPDVELRLFNADGGEAELSANGVRCVAALVVQQGLLPPKHVVFTVAGPRAVQVEHLGNTRFRVETDLGVPRLASPDVPMALMPPLARVLEHPLPVAGETWRVSACSLGNPHCAVFTDTPADDALVGRVGPALERHPAFPSRTNVEFVCVLSRHELRVRFWERGVGPTRSSGTGAASAAVAAILTGRAARQLRVHCDDGILTVDWPEGGPLRQVGEVELLFEGVWLVTA